MSPTNTRSRTVVERRPFGPTIPEPAAALRRTSPDPAHDEPRRTSADGEGEAG